MFTECRGVTTSLPKGEFKAFCRDQQDTVIPMSEEIGPYFVSKNHKTK